MSVNDPTQLVVAHKIGVDPGTPGLGTVTSLAAGLGITLTPNPITASGTVAGKLYTISTQGDVPGPGTNDHTQILFDDGWDTLDNADFPGDVHIGGKLTVDGIIDPPQINVENKVASDTATASVFMAATDSGANTFNVSAGIELPNSVSDPGDLVLRVNGAGASGSGTERMRLTGVGSHVRFGNSSLTAPLIDFLLDASVPSYDFNASPDDGSILGGVVFSIQDTTGVQAGGTLLFLNVPAVGIGSEKAISVGVGDPDIPVFSVTNDGELFSSSLAGISALFQTSATDGSNALPTLVARANTGQTAPLLLVDPTGAADTGLLAGSYFNTGDPATDFPFPGAVNIRTDPSGALPGLVISDTADPADDIAPLIVSTGGDGGSVLGAIFRNVDTGGNADLIVLGFSASDSASSHLFGAFQFQASGAADGTSFFGMGFDTTPYPLTSAAIQFWNNGSVFLGGITGAPGTANSLIAAGNVDAASYSVASAPGITGTVTTASLIGKTLTFTNGLITGFA